jgi:serine/threonine protein kinase
MKAPVGSPFSPDQPTRLISESVVERLRATGEFSADQLALIQEELNRRSTQLDCGPVTDLTLGDEIGGYLLESLIGEGGVARVFSARNPCGAIVALKLMRNSRFTDRFRREMELVQRLAHPNVVVAYEVGEHRDVPYIVMEQLAGPDLQAYVSKLGTISWQKSIELLIDAARGLEHAHQRGLIHRDVKPGNLMFDGDRIKVTDLGLAVLTGELDDNAEPFRTQAELAAGTPEFMAPEQAMCLASANELSDIYALGSTWFYLLTGRSRVQGKSITEKLSCLINNKRLETLPEDCVPEEVRHVFEKMVAHSPADRYASMTEVRQALEQIHEDFTDSVPRRTVEVLIVEDDQDDLFLTIEMLKRSNTSVTVHPAHSLAHALEQSENNPDIELVLLDLQLPDSAGADTVKAVRNVLPDVPILVLTGQEDLVVSQACIAAGADDFACKNDLNAHMLERMIFITLSRSQHKSSAAS